LSYRIFVCPNCGLTVRPWL